MTAPPSPAFLFPFISQFEQRFSASAAMAVHRSHPLFPLLVVALYLYFVAYLGPRLIPRLPPLPPSLLNTLLILWNLNLCLFSLCGFLRVFPFFLYTLTTSSSWTFLFCTPAMQAYGSVPGVGLWVVLFMWSKFAELLDTVLLVLRRKPVTFLHVFHHATVLLYCWYAGAAEQSTGIFFAVANYGVHSLMYFYYTLQALAAIGLCGRPSWGKLVTIVQLAQMALGVAVTAIHGRLLGGSQASDNAGSQCDGNRAVLTAAALMYAVYGGLFAHFFVNRYRRPKGE